MNVTVDIDRLTTHIRCGQAERAQALAAQVRELADQQLNRALHPAVGRALARAGLPPDALVAVRRLDLALKVAAGVDQQRLAEGWAAAFETALASLLAGEPPGKDGADAVAIWFADAWAAQRRHLERRADGQPDGWWAPDLVTDDSAAEALDALPILLLWLERDASRAVATMAELARADARIATLLSADAARMLTRRLIWALTSQRAAALPVIDEKREPAAAAWIAIDFAERLKRGLERNADLRAALVAAATGVDATVADASERAAPWLAAALFAANPALTRVPSAAVEDALQRWLTRDSATAARSAAPQISPPCSATRLAQLLGGGAPSTTGAASSPHRAVLDVPDAPLEILAGGLLLLLRPLTRLGLLPDDARLATRLGDLALAALRRVLAPLPAAERAVAEERERPLLAVFAPECDWRQPIATLPIHDVEATAVLLDALSEAIPADISFAAGAERRVFGRAPAAFASTPARRLARLLLRPGVLRSNAWYAELSWPLGCVDLGLRRAGWDQDPGWLPWLGRTIRFRYGDDR